MKPSERITQLAQPLIEAGLSQVRDALSKEKGVPLTDEEWVEFEPQLAGPKEQLRLNALTVATIAFLDEQAEAKPKTPV